MSYLKEPPFQHGSLPKIGILLVNLGTPEAATASALRPYLKEFLSDPRVIEIPKAIWWFILNGIILNTRPKKSAEKYAQIWTKEGSPLKVNTEKQAKLLKGYLGDQLKTPFVLEYAMRYGNPSIDSVLSKLREQNCDRILVLPLYPQYAASATATAFDKVFQSLAKMRNVPAIRTIKHYHDRPDYIQALAQSINEYWMQNGRPDKLVMSFHGVPRFSLDKGDPYHCECQKTGRLLAEALGLKENQYHVCFQSRFGRTEWLKPYTTNTLEELGKAGTKRVDTVCPGFTSDCLETLEEIAMEGKTTFLNAGGKEFHYIPCLNSRDDWIKAMRDIVMENLQGWISPVPDEAALQASKTRAIALGAKT
ncbi:ferrochelatase [Sulfurirhabdus autotrophica]|uniref:Ferrochelatase n=1 Tax=Sulfurirhabdus autotrophica TaxID=1706046 RepID=A0A4R3YE89_9PROT|nr:ferrochelatase [Sulfurirhabdus autotrophica]TCV90845.1 ferrochelatase [Sulfurirhabdus autotrophica]